MVVSDWEQAGNIRFISPMQKYKKRLSIFLFFKISYKRLPECQSFERTLLFLLFPPLFSIQFSCPKCLKSRTVNFFSSQPQISWCYIQCVCRKKLWAQCQSFSSSPRSLLVFRGPCSKCSEFSCTYLVSLKQVFKCNTTEFTLGTIKYIGVQH